ncbi:MULTISPECIES: hypothetical protein [Methanocalculus]|uniref:hypothetical protein n=1 Tax=Methanocalculus TaxID=71151 RepID=UPI00209DF2B8|nr:hypothetical protein [Methanocalculus sp. AMF5]MCP1662452.1 hypothetical protein [Methanocalculus sp. AMF5]
MEEWAKAWLHEQRAKGVKCLEIKYISKRPYVYHSTSRYDRQTKSPKKVSTYIGRLTKEEGLIPKGAKRGEPAASVDWIVEPEFLKAQAEPEPDEWGDGAAAHLPKEALALFSQIKESFPDCLEEILSLLTQRIEQLRGMPAGKEAAWAKPFEHSGESEEQRRMVQRLIGSNKAGQQAIGSYLQTKGRRIAIPFSPGSMQNEDPHHHSALLFAEADSGVPVWVVSLPGPQAEPFLPARTFLSLASPEQEPEESILFISSPELAMTGCLEDADCEIDVTPFQEAGVAFIYPLPHESSRYDTPLQLTDHFRREGRHILTGASETDGIFTYLFKDVRSATEEAEAINAGARQGLFDRKTQKILLRRAGRQIIVSSLNEKPEEIYNLLAAGILAEQSSDLMRDMFLWDIGGDERDLDARSGCLFISLLAAHLDARIRKRVFDGTIPGR